MRISNKKYLVNRILKISKKIYYLGKPRMNKSNLKRRKEMNRSHNKSKMKIKNNKIKSRKKRRIWNKIQI